MDLGLPSSWAPVPIANMQCYEDAGKPLPPPLISYLKHLGLWLNFASSDLSKECGCIGKTRSAANQCAIIYNYLIFVFNDAVFYH